MQRIPPQSPQDPTDINYQPMSAHSNLSLLFHRIADFYSLSSRSLLVLGQTQVPLIRVLFYTSQGAHPIDRLSFGRTIPDMVWSRLGDFPCVTPHTKEMGKWRQGKIHSHCRRKWVIGG